MTDADQLHPRGEMIIEWDVPIEMGDGLQLWADVDGFGSIGPRPHRMLLARPPETTGVSFQIGCETTAARLAQGHLPVTRNSTNKCQKLRRSLPSPEY